MEHVDQTNTISTIDAKLLTRQMAAFGRPTRAQSIWQLCNTLIPYVALWFAAVKAFEYSIWLALPVVLLLTGFMVRIFIVFHDCGHGAFFRSKKANDFWGVVMGILMFTPYQYWRDNHARHHATSGNLDKRGIGDIWMMTVDEYMQASMVERLKYRLYRNPIVMFLLGPLLLTLVYHRIPLGSLSRSERASIHWANLGVAIIAIALIMTVGWKAYLLIQLSPLFISHVLGVWLFYIQHQFEGVRWERETGWDFIEASLLGGSYYKLPAIMRWFSGSIGYHHVHHLNPRIPNYNLARCHNKVTPLQMTRPLKMFASLKALRYRLWDEANGRLIGFREAHRWRKHQATR